MTPRVRQTAEAALGGVQAPALLTSAVSGTENVGAGTSTSTALTPSVPVTKLLGGGGLTAALLLLALTTTGATPLRNAATSSATASAASATSSASATSAAAAPSTTATAAAAAASPAAADTSTSATTPTTTPTPSTASTTTSTAPATPTSAPAPLAPASAAAPARDRRSTDRLKTTEVGRSSRSNRGQEGGGGTPLEDRVACYRAAFPAELLAKNPPPMYITLYFIVTRLPNSLRAVGDHFLALDPTALTVDLLEQHLLAAETSIVVVGAARGTPRTPFFEGCSPSPLTPSYASAAAVDVLGAEDVGAASAGGKRHKSKGKGGRGGGGGSGGGDGGSSGGGGGSGGGGSSGSGGGSGGFGGGGGCSGRSGGSGSGGSGGGRTGAQHGEGAALGASESSLPGTTSAAALDTFMLDSGASRCFFRDTTALTPLPAPVLVRLADPSGGLVVARSSTVLPCPAVPPGSLSGLHLPSFSTNLASTAALQDAMVTTTTHGGQRVSICTCTRTGRHLATFTRWPGSSLYTLATEPSQVAASAQVFASGQVAPPCSCRLLSHQTLLWHHRLGHPSLPRLCGMHSCLLFVSSSASGFAMTFPSYVCTLIEGSFTLPDTPQKNGIAERRIGLVKEVARTSMIHAAAPHFLWPFAVRYAAHQLNLWPRVSLPKTSPTLCWTGKVGDASVFRDVTFDESVPLYRLFPHRSAPPPPPPLFLAPGPPPVDPLLPQGPAPSDVSQVDPLPGTVPVEVAGDSGAARGAESWGAEPGGAKCEGARSGGAEPGGAEPAGVEPAGGVEPGGAESEGAESGGAEPRGDALSGGPAGASPSLSSWPETLSSQQLREWLVRRARLRSGATGPGGTGDARAGGAGVTARAGGTRGTAPAEPGGARTRGTGAAGIGGVRGAGAGDPTEPGGAGAGGAGAGGTGAGAGGAGAVDPGAGGAGGTVRPRPYFVPLLQQVLGVPSSIGLPPPLLCPPLDRSRSPFQPASPLPAPSPYTEQTGSLTERREPVSRPASLVRISRRVPCLSPPPVPGTYAMALCLSSIPLRVHLPPPPEYSLPAVPDPESDCARAASPTVFRLLATVVTDPSFESTAASALVAELLDFAAACHLDYATALVTESESASPPSVGGECALNTDVLEDRQEDLECLAAAVPRFASMLLAPEGDPDAPDISAPRSYAEAIMGPYSSQWQAAMDVEMASWKSTGTYVNEVPPPGANIVDGMWIFRVKRPPGSPPTFKARYVSRGFSQHQGVDYFRTFSPTPKMTTLWVLLHVAAQRDYELRSLDFSTAFLQGSLHEEIWLRLPPGFTGSFPAGTQWSLRRPVYGLR
ncbi:unnamed protein product [Closterium sp. NIES-54]